MCIIYIYIISTCHWKPHTARYGHMTEKIGHFSIFDNIRPNDQKKMVIRLSRYIYIYTILHISTNQPLKITPDLWQVSKSITACRVALDPLGLLLRGDSTSRSRRSVTAVWDCDSGEWTRNIWRNGRRAPRHPDFQLIWDGFEMVNWVIFFQLVAGCLLKLVVFQRCFQYFSIM